MTHWRYVPIEGSLNPRQLTRLVYVTMSHAGWQLQLLMLAC